MNLSPETVLLLARDLTVPLARKSILVYRDDWFGTPHRDLRRALHFVVRGSEGDRARLVLAASEVETW